MKNTKIIIAIVVILAAIASVSAVLVKYTITPEQIPAQLIDQLTAQVIDGPIPAPQGGEEELTTSVRPESPDLLNKLNTFREITNERELWEKYQHLIEISEDEEAAMAPYLMEILSFMEQINKNPVLDDVFFDLLRMYPKHNRATFGNFFAFLFPSESDPLTFAEDPKQGILRFPHEPREFISRDEFMIIIGRIFLSNTNEDPADILATLGIIESESVQQWRDPGKDDGFLLIDAIRVVLNLREISERKNINQAKEEYEKNLVDLPDAALTLDAASLEVVLRAIIAEAVNAKKGLRTEEARTAIQNEFQGRFGEKLTSELVREMRSAFYRLSNQKTPPKTPPIYQLPERQFLGDCSNELFRKTTMGPLAKTGATGAFFICDQVVIQLPPNSYLVNLFSLPKLTPIFNQDYPDKTMFRSDVVRSLKNTLIIGSDGEQFLSMIFIPENIDQLQGKEFGFYVADHDNKEIMAATKGFSEEGAELRIHLRKLTGDNLVYFDPQPLVTP